MAGLASPGHAALDWKVSRCPVEVSWWLRNVIKYSETNMHVSTFVLTMFLFPRTGTRIGAVIVILTMDTNLDLQLIHI